MKKTLLFLFLVIPFNIFSQTIENNYELPLYKMDLPRDEVSGLITFAYVFKVDNATKDELYYRAKSWFSEKYNTGEDLLWVDDMERGILIGKPFTDILILEAGMGEMEKMYYTIKISVKDGRYKCEITDIQYQAYPTEFEIYPDKYTAESVIIDNLYKKKGKVRTTNLHYKEKTIESFRSLILDLQLAMNNAIVTVNSDEW